MSYKNTVLPIIREVREMVLPHYGLADIVHKKSTAPSDVVTELDQKVEKFLKDRLAEIYPDIEFVGEEYGGNRDAKKFWLVDPIDGTGHYVRGLPFCSTMLALIEDGAVIFSAIYDFVSDNMYWAEKGKGAFMNETPIQVSSRSIENSYMFYETIYQKEKNQKKFAELASRFHLLKTISAGWEFAMIASGKMEGRISFDPWGKDYDFAPGTFLVSEAGGVVVNINSDKYDYRNTSNIACNKRVFDEISKMFGDYE
jgi:myo-inositol-1(or 4)-monophosphatase